MFSGRLSLGEVVSAAVYEARRLFEATAAWILLYDPKENQLKMRCYTGPDEEAFKDLSIRAGIGVSGKVFLTQKPEIIAAPDKHPATIFYKKALSAKIPVIATYPLTIGEKKIGVFGVSSDKIIADSDQSRGFDPAMIFVKLVSIALDNAMVLEENKRSESELKGNVKSLYMLNEIGMDLVSDLDLSVIMSKVAQYTADILEADAAVINLANRKGTAVEAVYLHNMPPETENILRAKGTIARTVFEKPRRILINNYAGYPEAIEEFIKAGLQCVILVPVISKGKVLATLSAGSFRKERKFVEEDFDKLELMARQVAIAIENATLYSAQIETRKKIETYAGQLRLLNRLSHEIIREREPKVMADKLAKAARDLLDCNASVVLLYKGTEDNSLTTSWSASEDNPCRAIDFSLDLSTHDGLYSEILRTKRPIRLDDVPGHPLSKGVPDGHIALKGLLGSPLLDSDDNCIGHIMVTDRRDGSEFSETDEELLVALCTQVATGIEKAAAYKEQYKIAEVLQQAFLAVPKDLSGVEIGVSYESAAEAAKVGGDFYDLFEVGSSKIGILIGDVSGKGLEAATIASMVKSTIRAFAYKGLSPASVLTEANRVIYEQIRLNQFVTMMYGILDPQTGKLVTARAGHPDIIVWRSSGCEFCKTDSNLPLGIFAEIDYRQDEIVLSGEDTIILYTDGLTEAKCDNMFLGEDCMIKKLDRVVSGKKPQQIAFETVNIAKEFTGGKLQDDIAVVVLRLNP